MIIVVTFKNPVSIKSIKFSADSQRFSESQSAPSHIRLFPNNPNFSFADCESEPCAHEFDFTEEWTPLKLGKFNRLSSVTVFLQNDADASVQTVVHALEFSGNVVGYTAGALQKQEDH